MSSERHREEAEKLLGDGPWHYWHVNAIAAALEAAELRGIRAGLAAAGARAAEVAQRERDRGDECNADRIAVHDGAWFCAAELRDDIAAIDPASVEVSE